MGILTVKSVTISIVHCTLYMLTNHLWLFHNSSFLDNFAVFKEGRFVLISLRHSQHSSKVGMRDGSNKQEVWYREVRGREKEPERLINQIEVRLLNQG